MRRIEQISVGAAAVIFKAQVAKTEPEFRAALPAHRNPPVWAAASVDDVKLKGIIALVEVLIPALDPENKARLVQWGQDNINDFERKLVTKAARAP